MFLSYAASRGLRRAYSRRLYSSLHRPFRLNLESAVCPAVYSGGVFSSQPTRSFSTSQESGHKNKEPSNGGSEDTSSYSKQTGSEASNSTPPPSPPASAGVLQQTFKLASYIAGSIVSAHRELFGGEKESMLVRTVVQAPTLRRAASKDNEDSSEDSESTSGPSEMVVVKGTKNPWEAMRDRLQDSPFIRDVIRGSRKVTEAASQTDIGKAAVKIGQGVKDKIEDAREFWETSQNPLVYTVAGMVDGLTAETEEGMAIREIKKLDPKFIKEEWAAEIRSKVAPTIIQAHLRGDTKALKPWLGEAVYNKLAADIRVRRSEGLVFDSNILALDENMMLVRLTELVGPCIVMVYMVQQINCVKNRAGDIVVGAEDQIRAKFYSIAFRQVFDEDNSTVRWEVADYELAGDTPYI